MPTSSTQFVRTRTYFAQAAVGLAPGGLPAVRVAAYVVKSLPLGAVRWLVAVVAAYAAASMLMTASAAEVLPAPSQAPAEA